MIPLCNKELSNTLVGLYDDYQRGFEIGEQLKLCVDLALSLELELSIHRLSEGRGGFRGPRWWKLCPVAKFLIRRGMRQLMR
ncbi:hypothetical protein BVtw_15460 [Bartonella vinsonii subsp. berkhoffii str. Tweed]|uniref:Uncharacterized protein n=1 Tax=Bartonella vinsonii subsp. berkhoffii str. Tweed TaxID=1094502 RepID=N6UL88_BARVB|nr:hypothetical protein [Bartonella vinsonii]ENN93154.1 hypothetical protein BVtw_15460 [Bartonella vinsonii subsp. berkhoffii str. Tweed]